MMFKEFQGEFPGSDNYSGHVSVCLDMGEWLGKRYYEL